MRHYSILEYARLRWFKAAVALFAFMMLAALIAHAVSVSIYW